MGVDGTVETYKARLVVKDYSQKPTFNYKKTFSPVVILKSIRILIFSVAHLDYEIW